MAYCSVGSRTLFSITLIFVAVFAMDAFAQQRIGSVSNGLSHDAVWRDVGDQSSHPPLGVTVADYTFGPGDILSVSIDESPELSGSFEVGNDGYIALPYVGQIKAAGLNGLQLTQSVAANLKKTELLVDPIVNVGVEEYHSRAVQVLGAVAKPAEYPLQRPTRLLELISRAGGLAPNAGNIVTISRQGDSFSSNGSILTIDLSKLVRGQDPVANVEVRGGDVVSVSIAPIIYVLGAVNRPGGFAFTDPGSGITALQAIALAEGLKSIAAPKRCLLVRTSPDGKERQRVPIDVGSILSKKSIDPFLQPNDILYVPDSGPKKTLEAMGRIAEGGAIGAATYGIGLRAGQ
jgi:polysaccharide export outer membrane protein